ncbi:MAG: RNA polymerase sigma factor [Polyangia bacterium]
MVIAFAVKNHQAVEQLYREKWGYVLATLIRVLGDFDLAEEAAQEAFAVALEQWPQDGAPENATAWLVQTARHKAMDIRRRRANLTRKTEQLEALQQAETDPSEAGELPDDRLRLIFACCHPTLAIEAQVALTLRTLCGLTTEEIAHAFLVPPTTMAQRLVRAKAKIRGARIPYHIPDEDQMTERVEAVTAVIYLVFNEGYFSSEGEQVIRRELCAEAIQLARMLKSLLSSRVPPEVDALLALMLLQDSRSDARLNGLGELVLLEDQDRRRWNHHQITEGLALVDGALKRGGGVYGVQAAIAALHALAQTAADTDWKQIAVLYDILGRLNSSPVVSLNHAVAVAMADGPAAGLALIDQLSAAGTLSGYYLLHAARADLLRRMNRREDAAAEYRRALELGGNVAERLVLQGRLEEVTAGGGG